MHRLFLCTVYSAMGDHKRISCNVALLAIIFSMPSKDITIAQTFMWFSLGMQDIFWVGSTQKKFDKIN